MRLDQVLAELAQDDLVAQQLGRLIIDQQDVDLVVRAVDGRATSSFSDAATSAAPTAAARC